jgi:hypothetical protein
VANEIQISGVTSGWNVYAVVTTAAGLLTDGSGGNTAAYSAANWDTYDIPLTEAAATSGKYQGNFGLVAGQYYGVEIRRRTTGTPAIAVATDPYIGGGNIGAAPANVSAWAADPVATPTLTGYPRIDVYALVGDDTAANSLRTLSEDYSSGSWSVNITSVTLAYTVGTVLTGAIARDSFSVDTGLQTIRSGTATGGTSSTITLSIGSSAVNDYYVNDLVYITSGVGAGQVRQITAYVAATRVATVTPAWTTTPTSSSVFAVLPAVSPWNTVGPEPTGVPAATATMLEKVGRLYQALVSQLVIDDGTATKTFYSFAGAALWKKTMADTSTTYTESSAASP